MKPFIYLIALLMFMGTMLIQCGDENQPTVVSPNLFGVVFNDTFASTRTASLHPSIDLTDAIFEIISYSDDGEPTEVIAKTANRFIKDDGTFEAVVDTKHRNLMVTVYFGDDTSKSTFFPGSLSTSSPNYLIPISNLSNVYSEIVSKFIENNTNLAEINYPLLYDFLDVDMANQLYTYDAQTCKDCVLQYFYLAFWEAQEAFESAFKNKSIYGVGGQEALQTFEKMYSDGNAQIELDRIDLFKSLHNAAESGSTTAYEEARNEFLTNKIQAFDTAGLPMHHFVKASRVGMEVFFQEFYPQVMGCQGILTSLIQRIYLRNALHNLWYERKAVEKVFLDEFEFTSPDINTLHTDFISSVNEQYDSLGLNIAFGVSQAVDSFNNALYYELEPILPTDLDSETSIEVDIGELRTRFQSQTSKLIETDMELSEGRTGIQSTFELYYSKLEEIAQEELKIDDSENETNKQIKRAVLEILILLQNMEQVREMSDYK